MSSRGTLPRRERSTTGGSLSRAQRSHTTPLAAQGNSLLGDEELLKAELDLEMMWSSYECEPRLHVRLLS